MRFKEAKAIIRNYLREFYTDRDLIRALDHARAGKLAFYSCCCVAGIPGADHELRGFTVPYLHYPKGAPGELVSNAYRWLGLPNGRETTDEIRRRILISMILAEIKRRARTREMEIQPCMS